MKFGRPVYVVGSGRSGTTVLDRSLGFHPWYSSMPFEPQIFASADLKAGVWKMMLKGSLSKRECCVLRGYLGRRYKVSNPRAGKIGYFKWFSRREFMKHVDSLIYGESELEARIRSFFETLHEPLLLEEKSDNWIDGTPVNGRILPQILRVFPGAKFIHVIRDGLEVANSLVRLGWAGGTFETAAQFWVEQVSVTRSLGREYGQGNYLEVFFSDLVASPEAEMKRICDFVGIDFHDSMVSLLNEKRAGKYIQHVTCDQRRYVDSLIRGFNLDLHAACAIK